jgi:transcriptional regulator
MYLPSHFEEKRLDVLHALIQAHPFGTLVTLAADGLNANHIPFELVNDGSPFGTLRAHVARANPVWRDFSADVEAMAIFQGAHAYITPAWYPTKQEHGKAVPTWNYMVVHAYGPLKVIDDTEWLRGLVTRLTDRHEGERTGKEPWKVTDAPADYIDKMLSAIVGLEIPVTRLIGKWKVSQNQPEANRRGVVAGLQETGGENAKAVADAVNRPAQA